MKEILDGNVIKILKGSGIAFIITCILLFIYAVLLTYTNIGENTMIPAIILISAVSTLARWFYSELAL